jgi:hypothetical protein
LERSEAEKQPQILRRSASQDDSAGDCLFLSTPFGYFGCSGYLGYSCFNASLFREYRSLQARYGYSGEEKARRMPDIGSADCGKTGAMSTLRRLWEKQADQ